MMRAMYSGVAGLKTHQTKMDVIGNNIANVNTVAFKSSSTTFSEIMYQNVSGASGPSATTGRGGVNAKQIGLGVTTGSTTVNISSPGSAQTTGDGFDLMITGDSFFVVNNGSSNLFTKAGAFYIDGAGNLAMKSTGYNVMGWQVDPATGDIRKDMVSPLKIMTENNLTSPPEATTNATCGGILDRNSTAVNSDKGYAMSLSFVDALGYQFTAKFAVRSTKEKGEYTVELEDIMDVNGTSVKDLYNVDDLASIVSFGEQITQQDTANYNLKENVRFDPNGDPATGNPPAYYRSMSFPEFVTDGQNRVSGFTYRVTAAANGQAVPAEGTMGPVSASVLQKNYSVTYDPENNTYYNNGIEITDDEWRNILGVPADGTNGITGFTVNKEVDGSMTFTLTQDFTLMDGAEIPAGSTDFSIYEVPITNQVDAYEGLDTSDPNKTYDIRVTPTGIAQVTSTRTFTGSYLKFDVDTGLFVSIGGADSIKLDFANNVNDRLGNNQSLQSFSDIDIDFTTTKWFENGGSSTMGMDPGAVDGETGKGKKLGDLIGLSVSNDGTIWGSYDNGNTTLLGQIAVAVFANPSGLEKVGENCYQTTLNSGEFDGIGQDITADGGKMTSGQLEMSNVDLSTEFTEMITTQRGFQANSRIITTSDTLLEELINLKR